MKLSNNPFFLKLTFYFFTLSLGLLIYPLAQAETESARYFNRLGKESFARQDYENALAYFNKAIEFDPNYVYPRINIAVVYIKKGDYEAAISQLKKAEELNPQLPEIYAQLATAFEKKGELALALEYSKKAISLRQDSPRSIYNLGFTYVLEGDRVSALKQYRRLKQKGEESLTNRLLEKIQRKFMSQPSGSP